MDNFPKIAIIGLVVLLAAGTDMFRAFQPAPSKHVADGKEDATSSDHERPQVAQLLQQRFPSVPVSLTPYPPPPANVFLSRILGGGQLAGIALVFGGDVIFPALGFPQPPGWYQSFQQNKIGTAAGIWILGNMGHNMLLSTGAFEVSYEGQLVFSKLQENRMPSTDEIMFRLSKAVEEAQSAPAAQAEWIE